MTTLLASILEGTISGDDLPAALNHTDRRGYWLSGEPSTSGIFVTGTDKRHGGLVFTGYASLDEDLAVSIELEAQGKNAYETALLVQGLVNDLGEIQS